MKRSDPPWEGHGVPWDRKSIREGRRAYKQGKTLQANPYPNGTLAKKSWAAGWADEAKGALVDGERAK